MHPIHGHLQVVLDVEYATDKSANTFHNASGASRALAFEYRDLEPQHGA